MYLFVRILCMLCRYLCFFLVPTCFNTYKKKRFCHLTFWLLWHSIWGPGNSHASWHSYRVTLDQISHFKALALSYRVKLLENVTFKNYYWCLDFKKKKPWKSRKSCKITRLGSQRFKVLKKIVDSFFINRLNMGLYFVMFFFYHTRSRVYQSHEHSE